MEEFDNGNTPPQDAATYQSVLDRVAADEWSLVALSKHRTRDEFLFLYHFPGGRNDAAFSVRGAKGDPQPVGIDTFEPMKVEWKTRKWTFLDLEGFSIPHSGKIGYRHPIYRTLEDITVDGRFGNYDVLILFNREKRDWEFDVAER